MARWVRALLSPARAATQAGDDVLVFAAASLQTALDDLSAPVQKATGARMRMSYAASSALARQIENGAPAGLFISADLDWMNYLADRKLVRTESRVNLLGNRLVLVGTKGRQVSLKIGPGFGLAQALGRERLALADPAAVPAGKYAREALTTLGVWDGIANKIAATENVRAALLLVSRGEAPLGIVYRTRRHGRCGRRRGRHISGVVARANHLSRGVDGARHRRRPARSWIT